MGWGQKINLLQKVSRNGHLDRVTSEVNPKWNHADFWRKSILYKGRSKFKDQRPENDCHVSRNRKQARAELDSG